MTQGERKAVIPRQGTAPDEETIPGDDPGERAMAEYRRWRAKYLGDSEVPRRPETLVELFALMREEVGGEAVGS